MIVCDMQQKYGGKKSSAGGSSSGSRADWRVERGKKEESMVRTDVEEERNKIMKWKKKG